MTGIGYTGTPGLPGPDDEVTLETVAWGDVDLDDVDWGLLREFLGDSSRVVPEMRGTQHGWALSQQLNAAWNRGLDEPWLSGFGHLGVSRDETLAVLRPWVARSEEDQMRLLRCEAASGSHASGLDLRDVVDRVQAAAVWPVKHWPGLGGPYEYVDVPLVSLPSSQERFRDLMVGLDRARRPGWVKTHLWHFTTRSPVPAPLALEPDAAAAAARLGVLQDLGADVFRRQAEWSQGLGPALLPEQPLDLVARDPVRVARQLAGLPDRASLAAAIRLLLAMPVERPTLAWSLLAWSAPTEETSLQLVMPVVSWPERPAVDQMLEFWDWVASTLEGAMPIPDFLPWDGPRDPVPLERLLQP